MMQGRVKDGRASVPITFRLSNQPGFQIEFVVDTGIQRLSNPSPPSD
jgi:predicted aspartyl protease